MSFPVPSGLVRPRPVVVFAGGLILLLAGAAWLYESQREHLRQEAEKQLDTIARLKVAQIVEWRRERLADAALVRQTPYAARRALDALADTASPTTRRMFTSWLQPLLATAPYQRALLVDAQLNVCLSHPPGADGGLCAEERRAAAEALRTREVAVADLHRAEANGPVQLSLMVPLVVRREGNNDNVPAAGVPASPGDRSAGVLVLQCDARNFLFPLIQSWPVPSRSAETQLVRREGDEVVFLNELRHQRDTALKLRIAMSRQDVASVQAAQGRKDTVQGRDYRGVKVLASLKPIPDSPWFLVAKVDAAEAFAPRRFESVLILVLLLALVALAGALALVVWHRSEKAHYQALFQSEAARRQGEERFRATFDQAAVGMAQVGPDGRWLRVNQKLCDIVGYSREELLQKTFQDITHPEDLETDLAFVRQMLAGEIQTYTMEKRYLRQAGGIVWIDLTVSLVREPSGQPQYFISVIEDITARKQAEAALRESESRFRAYVTASSNVVYRMSADWSEMYSLVGRDFLPDTDTANRTWLDKYLHPDDQPQVLAAIHEAIRARSVFALEHRVRRVDGSLGWTSSRAVPLLDARGGITEWLGAAVDVTERKQAEQEIRQLNAELERRVEERTAQLAAANQELEAFAYSVSHDLRAPLRAIDGFSRILTEDHERHLDGEGRRVLGIISCEAQRMGQLVDDLLAFSRLGRQKLDSSDINLTALARAVWEQQAAQAPRQALQLELQELPPARGDRAMIRVVLVNLLANAVKFSKHRNPAVIEIGAVRSDDGRGTSDEKDMPNPVTRHPSPIMSATTASASTCNTRTSFSGSFNGCTR